MTDHTRRADVLSGPHLAAGLAMIATALVAVALVPTELEVAGGGVELDALVPAQVGSWREVPSVVPQVDLTPRRDGEERARTTDEPYDQTLMRTYVRTDGARVMLALAYGARQRQEVKIHRPELCYAAQGFEVGPRHAAPIVFRDGGALSATRLVARTDRRIEPVTYWIRIGEEIVPGAVQSRLAILREGLKGRVPDGILVRVSTIDPPGGSNIERAYRLHEEFLRDLGDAVGARGKMVLAGAGVALPRER